MRRKNWMALILAGMMVFSLVESVSVFADDVTFDDQPFEGEGGDDIEAYDPDTVETSAPESYEPDTEAYEEPETEAYSETGTEGWYPSETEEWYPQETEGWYPPETEGWYPPEQQWAEENYYDDGYYDDQNDGGYQEDLDEDSEKDQREYSGDASTLGPDLVIDDFELLSKEDAEKDFELPEKDLLPSMFFMNLEELFQEPDLPTGCEATALTMALLYEEFDTDQKDIAENYMLYNREDDNMATGFIGDPFSEEGAGCFSPAIAATADYFFARKGAKYRAYDITETKMEDLYRYVAAGHPVLVWTTMHMQQPTFQNEISEYKDHLCRWYSEEHCVVLTGYNMEEGTVQLNDPLDGIVQRDMAEFAAIYEATGENSIVLKEQEDDRHGTGIKVEVEVEENAKKQDADDADKTAETSAAETEKTATPSTAETEKTAAPSTADTGKTAEPSAAETDKTGDAGKTSETSVELPAIGVG